MSPNDRDSILWSLCKNFIQLSFKLFTYCAGYYRVLYDEENWKRLSSILNSEHYVKISPVNRAQILNDAVQFSLKRQLDMGTFLDIFTYLQRETDYVPWYDAQFIFSFLNYHLSNTKAYDSLRVTQFPILPHYVLYMKL